MKPDNPVMCHVLHLLAGALGLLLLAGCSTPPEAPRTVTTPGGRSLEAGFVYEEAVHPVGKPFSLEGLYWDSFFPEAATAFEASHRFDSYEEALRSDVDVLVIGKATVHGARDGCKMTLELVCRDLSEKELLHHGFRDKKLTGETAEAVFESLGRQTAGILSEARKLRRSSPRVLGLNYAR